MNNNKSLQQRLLTETKRFSFFQAVRLLLKSNKALRMQSNHSLKFAVNDLEAIQKYTLQGKSTYSLSVNFLSLISPTGILPMPYTSTVLKKMRSKGHALLSFLNIFEQRAIHLFYQAFEKTHSYISYERENSTNNPQQSLLKSFTGINFDEIDTPSRLNHLFYVSHFAKQQRSAATLQQLLSHYFHCPAEIISLMGQWQTLSNTEQTSLGALNSRLGDDLFLGSRTWQCQHRFRIVLGPLNWQRMQSFLPGGNEFKQLCQLTRQYVGIGHEFDIQLKVDSQSILPWKLGQQTEALGWQTYLGVPAHPFNQSLIMNPRFE